MNIDDYIFRTEDIKDEELLELYVESKMDRENINFIKTKAPLLLVGSRGTGKTMLLKVAEKEMDDAFQEERVLCIFISFKKAIFLETIDDPQYFKQWMIAKILFAMKRKIEKKGLQISHSGIFGRYFDVEELLENSIMNKLQSFIKILESSSRKRNFDFRQKIKSIFLQETEDIEVLNELDYFHALIEDICEEININRIVFLFDEACHNFIPSQQREFFTLFRDLRSSLISCKAAVYPGITSYGTFQQFHDATIRRVERDLHDPDFISIMRDIIRTQTKEEVYKKLEQHGELLDYLIYAATGNPRLLLKSIHLSSSKNFNSTNVNSTIKDFYRNNIWNEHTKLGEIYKGHKKLVDWGRDFLEKIVLVDTNEKNETRFIEGKKQQTIYFAIHRDAPEAVKQAIRILEYSGIVSIETEGTRVRGEVFDRYQINIGIILSTAQSPTTIAKHLVQGLSVKLYTDYGMKSSHYHNIPEFSEQQINFNDVIERVLEIPVDFLDISDYQRIKIKSVGFDTLGDILNGDEDDLQRAEQIGPKRARRIYNVAYNATMEYFSG
ncbi:helix-hairpin-helix domain-containing protein [Paenibacillus assamensis]|uniref:helix-hairpin-helix domain-containing protein n=1 Tax=Paenibacillus assamensis TaxID=311244 RepID=UPI0004281F86|nr:helix-hairpin-helix domain-containing protein [Paenibacillus assamensis]